MTRSRIRSLALAALMTAPALPVAANDLALLQSYAGEFAGSGVAVYETGATDPVDCRIGLEAGGRGRMYLRGTECRVAGTLITLKGVMAFLANGRFEAAVTSNAGFSGGAIGSREGDEIRFALQDGKIGDGSLALAATFVLSGGSVSVRMEITSNVSGAVTQVEVPMDRIR